MSGSLPMRLSLLTALLLLISSKVWADSVKLQSASLSAGSSNLLSLQGNGLALEVAFNQPAFPQVNNNGLTKFTINLSPANVSANSLLIGGVDYSRLKGTITFSIDLTQPTVRPDFFGVTDTRTFSGTLAIIDPKTGEAVGTLSFKFKGTAQLLLAGNPCGDYFIKGITARGIGKASFHPAAVPEPTTLLLLSSGLTTIGLCIRQKRPPVESV